MREQRSLGQLLDHEVAPHAPLDEARYADVLAHIHRCELNKQQSTHDELLLEEQVLLQKRTSGTQAHAVTKDKRNLDKLIRSVRKKRHLLIANMKAHVDYLQAVPGETQPPEDWLSQAREGSPFWGSSAPGPDGAPSQREIESIVVAYLKRNRAWEQLTDTVPREAHDAIEHFSLLEAQAHACVSRVILETQEALSSSGSLPASYPTRVDVLHGRIITGKDLISSVEAARRQCAAAWGSIVHLVNESAPVAEVASGPFPIDSVNPFIAASHIPYPQQLIQGSLVGAMDGVTAQHPVDGPQPVV